MNRQSRLKDRARNQSPPAVSREPVPYPRKQKKRASRNKFLLAALFLSLFSLAALTGLISFAFLFYYSDLLLPGAEVAGIPVGSLTTHQAAARLAEQAPRQEILLAHSMGTWPVSATDLGLELDVEATIAGAYALGRTLPGLGQVAAGDLQVEPFWSVDSGRAAALFDRLSAQVEIPPTNARVVVENGQVHELPARQGLAFDLGLTMSYLQENPAQIVRDGRLPLATSPIDAPLTDVSEYVGEAQRLLSRAVTIRAYDPVQDETAEWVIQPSDWQGWLSLEINPGEPDPFSWAVDEGAAQQFLAGEWSWLGGDRYLDSDEIAAAMIENFASGQTHLDVRVHHRPVQHTVSPGDSYAAIGYNYGIPYPWIQQANPGKNNLAAGDVITIPSADDLLPLPVVPGKRVVVSLDQQRAWVYEDGDLKWDWPASTGISSSPTSPGVFQIQSHQPQAYASNWDLFMPNFMGVYRPLPQFDFMNGFHGFPTRDGNTLLWTGDLGHPVTYGCILLSSENAQALYDWAEEGVVVEIQP